MLTELNEKLTKIAEGWRERERLERRIAAAEERLSTEQKTLVVLRGKLDEAAEAVTRLEGRSLAGLYYAVLGEREMRFKKERERFLAAQLKHDQSEHAVWSLKSELDELRSRYKALEGLDEAYEAALAEKEHLLATAHDSTAQQLLRLGEGLAEARAEGKELDEALQAGRDLLVGLKEVVNSLKSAEGWGTWDMLGGGLVATAVKHKKLDEARAKMHAVQAQLGRFQRELADVMVHGTLADDISSFDVTADYLLDNLITDWIVQSKIKRSLESVLRLQERARAILAELESEWAEVQERNDFIAQERQALIEAA
jgi:hypothetical protein